MKPIKDSKIKADIEKAKKALRHFHYMRSGPNGNIDKVLCKGCGAVLQSLVPDERYTYSKIVNGQKVVYKMLVMAQTQQYSEVAIEMEDGSAHITALCQTCATHPPNLQDLYAADLSRLSEIGGDVEQMGKKKPIKLKRI